MLDDNIEEDVLVHFLPSITFIQAELDKGRGVLVHCQAGISESYHLSLLLCLTGPVIRSQSNHRCSLPHV